MPIETVGIGAYIDAQADAWKVDPALANYVWTNEGGDNLTVLGDMNITCKTGVNAGKPVRAKGPWQITDCYHPEVSDQCAFNLECSTKIAMPLLKDKKTCEKQFTTCKAYYSE